MRISTRSSMARAPALAAMLLAGMGCRSGSITPAPPEGSAAPQGSAANGSMKRFGEPIGAGPTASLNAILREAERYRDKTVIAEGLVRKACSRKGCWMELAEGSDQSLSGCRVTFKDYGFFVPTDSAGARARVQGTVMIHKVLPQWVAHMEEEGAHFAGKNPDGSANEVRVVATGVELTR